MYCLWKTQGLTIEPWREDIVFGSTLEDGILYISVKAEADWEGQLRFGADRHHSFLNLPMDYPRINQFPEWYSVLDDEQYMIDDKKELIFSGLALRKGLDIQLEKDKPYLIKVRKTEI